MLSKTMSNKKPCKESDNESCKESGNEPLKISAKNPATISQIITGPDCSGYSWGLQLLSLSAG